MFDEIWQEIELKPDVWVDVNIYYDEDEKLCLDVYKTALTESGFRRTCTEDDPILSMVARRKMKED